MALALPTREDISTDFTSDYSTAQPTKSVSRGSIPYAFARAVSAIAWGILSKLVYFDRNRLPDTQDLPNLIREGNARAFKRKEAQGSSGALALQVSGTPASALGVNPQLTHADGTIYQVTTVGAVIGGGGTVIVDVAAISAGLATNKVTGEALTFSAPPLGVTAAAVLVAPLTNGLDVEDKESYRARLLAHIGDPPEGGAIVDYIEWALSLPGAASAYVWRHRRGGGTIDIAVLGGGSGSGRVVTNLVPFTNYIESKRPGNVKDWKMLTTVPTSQPVTSAISIDATLYKWDWDDVGIGYVITAHDSVAGTITVPSAPITVVAGVRLQVNGEEAKVTARVGNVLTLAFSAPPATWWNPSPVAPTWFVNAIVDATSVIRCSGDLVVPVRNAILGLFAGLGPARTTASTVSFAAVAWEDSIKYSKMYAAITDVKGVTDALLTVPAANVVPTDDPLNNPTLAPFLVPGVVQVLKQ